MLDIKLVRENPDLVKENIKKKFQEEKLALVDEVIELDKKFRESKQRADELRASRNKISKEIGGLMAKGLREEAEKTKQKVAHLAKELEELEGSEETLSAEIKKRMMVIPNIIGDDVPIGKDDSENVELQRFGEPYVPPFEIPYHVDIMESSTESTLIPQENERQRLLLSLRRYCKTPLCGALICARFYDRQRLHILRSAVYDKRKCC